MNAPIRVAVTGAAGNIGYALLWRIATGTCFGPDQPVILHLIEIPMGMERLHGVVMELEDSALPLVHGVVATSDLTEGFMGVDAAFLVGSRPRTKDMDRADLVSANGPIFVGQGKALNDHASRTVKVVVVGNPCNTNALIACANAPDLDDSCFSAMTRLDQNRAVGQLASKAAVVPTDVSNVVIWGNHANTMYPDVSKAKIQGKAAASTFDQAWLRGEFLETVANRGKAVIVARGASSAASAASAAHDHMRDWWHGTNGAIVSMAIRSHGWYGVPKGLMFSFPCKVDAKGHVTVVEDFVLDAFGQAKLDENVRDLSEERDAVANLL
jgi:malate dehydrogenase